MTNKCCTFAKATVVATSPIKLSSGADWLSDADVLVDAAGMPFIPGTTLAGVMRHYVAALHKDEGKDGKDFVNSWFGYIESGKDEGTESRLHVHDAFPVSDASISLRDGVRLNERKTVDGNGKFDYQVVDADTEFEIRLEAWYADETQRDGAEDLIRCLFYGIKSGEVKVGGKTSRGFGTLDVRAPQVLGLDLTRDEDRQRYVGFDWHTSEFDPLTLDVAPQGLFDPEEIITLELVSPLMIRDYATIESSGHDNKLVDARTLRGKGNDPVVPGTSWAGAFRHHMERILAAANYDETNDSGDTAQEFLNEVFGCVQKGSRAKVSQIEFSESVVSGSKDLNITRTAVDRFTGGAADHMLFTNRVAYGGTTELRIRWRSSLEPERKALLKSLLAVCVEDLLDGTLAVGGMTAIGYGMFRKDTSVRNGEVTV